MTGLSMEASALWRARMTRAILGQLLPEEIERLELLQFASPEGRPLMLQIYTRSFIMAMATQNVSLRTPTISPLGKCS